MPTVWRTTIKTIIDGGGLTEYTPAREYDGGSLTAQTSTQTIDGGALISYLTDRTQRSSIATSWDQRITLRKYIDYLRGLDDTETVNDVTDHLDRQILIFSRQGFEEVPYGDWTQRSVI